MRKAYYTKDSQEEVVVKRNFTSKEEGVVRLVNDCSHRKGRNRGVERREVNTPFAMIRKMLKMTRKELSDECRIAIRTGYRLDVGEIYPSPVMAKTLQEVARRNGLAVTLDELYQNLVIDFDRLLNPNRESASPIGQADSSQCEDMTDEYEASEGQDVHVHSSLHEVDA